MMQQSSQQLVFSSKTHAACIHHYNTIDRYYITISFNHNIIQRENAVFHINAAIISPAQYINLCTTNAYIVFQHNISVSTQSLSLTLSPFSIQCTAPRDTISMQQSLSLCRNHNSYENTDGESRVYTPCFRSISTL